MKKRFYAIVAFILLTLSKAGGAFAFSINDLRKETFKPVNLPGIQSNVMTAGAKINVLISFAIDLILYASGSLSVLLLVIGGIRYVVSFGQQDAMDKAKKTIQFALIGLIAVILAYFIITNITRLLYETAG